MGKIKNFHKLVEHAILRILRANTNHNIKRGMDY